MTEQVLLEAGRNFTIIMTIVSLPLIWIEFKRCRSRDECACSNSWLPGAHSTIRCDFDVALERATHEETNA